MKDELKRKVRIIRHCCFSVVLLLILESSAINQFGSKPLEPFSNVSPFRMDEQPEGESPFQNKPILYAPPPGGGDPIGIPVGNIPPLLPILIILAYGIYIRH